MRRGYSKPHGLATASPVWRRRCYIFSICSIHKHEILDKYAHAYMRVLHAQSFVSRVVYVDAFAGAGVAEDRESGELRLGSALVAQRVQPPFDELHFVEANEAEGDRSSTKNLR